MIPSKPKNSSQSRITTAFDAALSQRKAALMPYFTLGYPDRDTSLQIIESIAPFSDLLELGIPFSDPIADGPTIQRSTQLSLDQGTTLTGCLEMIKELRHRGIETPILLMGYYNPILAYGEERFVIEAANVGADGFIVPDLPPEEAEALQMASDEAGLAVIYFLAPTSSSQRIQHVIKKANGFIYMVSVTGVTGARSALQSDIREFVEDVKTLTDVPVAVGFGISSPAQASQVGNYADGVIIGSAIIDIVAGSDNKVAAAAAFVKELHSQLATA